MTEHATVKPHRDHRPRLDKPVPKKAYSMQEGCDALGITRPTMYKLISEGKVRTVMVGRRRLIPVAELDQLLAFDQ
jgi:excisionase family DNA binding protein